MPDFRPGYVDDVVTEPQTKRVHIDRRDDGSLILTNPVELEHVNRSMVHVFLERAEQFPERTLIAELDGEGQWQHLTYADAVAGCRSVAQWLLDNGGSVERPLVILSGSSIRHFLMAWGAQLAAVPYVPVSTSYSTISGAHPKLAAVLDLVAPGFMFAEDLATYDDALAAVGFDRASVTVISAGGDAASGADFDDLVATVATAEVDGVIDTVDHDTVTRYMFTSGSTGMPKGVIQTHGMACRLIAGVEARGRRGPSQDEIRVLEWMPWSHVGAGVMRVNSIVNSAGSIYLDTGRPVPGEHQATIDNLRVVKPTMYVGPPLGWTMLADALEADDELAQIFFSNVKGMASGAAAMPLALADRLADLTEKYTGRRVMVGSGLKSTEVSLGLAPFWPTASPNVIGLPEPGATIKLLPLEEDRYELRVLSGATTPGYFNAPEKTEAAFDDEGYYCMGDAVKFFDPDDPDEGLVFAGRVAEQFKLQTGTWVSAGSLRAEIVTATSPYVRDAVICGLNQTYVAALVWLNLDQSADLDSGAVHGAIAAGLGSHKRVQSELVAKGSALPCARDATGRRSERDHRQGLHEPRRGSGSPRRRCSSSLLRRARPCRDRGPVADRSLSAESGRGAGSADGFEA